MTEQRVETDQRPTHVVYRIGSEFSYQETPCFCPARQAHSILDTACTPPAPTAPECMRSASCEDGDHTYSWPCVHAVIPPEGGAS